MAFTTKKTKIEQIKESLETVKYMAECALEDLKALAPVRTQSQDFRIESALSALGQLKGEGTTTSPWGWIQQSGQLVLNPIAALMWGFATVYSSLTDDRNAQYYKQTPVKLSMVHDNGIGFMVIDNDTSYTEPSVLWSSRHNTFTELAELPEWETTMGLTAEELKDIQDYFGHKTTARIPYLEMANELRAHLVPKAREIKLYVPYTPPVHVPYQAKVETVGAVAPLGDVQTPHPALSDLPSATQAEIEDIRASLTALETEELEEELVAATPGTERAIGFYGCE